MEGKELRIGNFIQYNEGVECKVIGIHEFGIDVEFPEETTYIEYDQFSPIPLTEEWLKKFGFNKKGEYWFCKSGYLIGFFAKKWFIGKYNFDDMVEMIVPFDSVHQLQNIYFALTGEELSVIN